MSAPTPGPWHVAGGTHVAAHIDDEPESIWVADCNSPAWDGPTKESNARLVAAAPEMRDLLSDLVSGDFTDLCSSDLPDCDCWVCTISSEAQDLIAKLEPEVETKPKPKKKRSKKATEVSP